MTTKKLLALFVTCFALVSSAVQAEPEIELAPNNDTVLPRLMPKKNPQKLFISGYGEFHYNNKDNANDTLEVHRFTLGVNYDFNDWIQFRSEFEFEHAFREYYIEFAYLDFLVHPRINFRVGSLIMPIGHLNAIHEPTTFYSVERPDIYKRIIPTSWMEGGAGIYGEIIDGLHYQLYGHTSLDFNNGYNSDTGFSGSSGIRGGRGKVSDVTANNFAGSARLVYTGWKHMRLGTSGFIGKTAQGDSRVSGGLLTLLEADAKFFFEGFELEGIVSVIFNPDSAEMTIAQRADGNIGATDVIGQRMFGVLIEGAYHVFHHAWKDAPIDLVTFVRYEKTDTHHKVASAFTKNGAYDQQNFTFGLALYPINQVVIKADYQIRDQASGTANNQFNLGVGYYF